MSKAGTWEKNVSLSKIFKFGLLPRTQVAHELDLEKKIIILINL